ncbi:hypothetical protein SAMN05877838_2598 [Hoeflea halophila]|uniref:Uncharacterized protein n=1 Tax=Hoeflea halophila TaxID=714899 RepID=A0A286IC46_9HYPH|nr:hypothetical protein SAMN05877838_2598 [Hoeflea halophila]
MSRLFRLEWWGMKLFQTYRNNFARGSGVGGGACYRFGRSRSATTSTWLDHRNWSIGVTEVSR